jgi:anaerobic selenocysteine-containing dehydrogenase
VPKIPEELYQAAKEDRMNFGVKLITWAAKEPGAFKAMPFILAKTLGKEWDSAAKAALWGMLMTAPATFRENAARAGFKPDMDQGDKIFAALLDNPQGIWAGKADTDTPMAAIKTPSKKIEIFIPELEEQAGNLNAEDEAEALKLPKEFPLILNAGRHSRYTMNTLMRNPEWNKGKRDCTISLHPADALSLGLMDGGQAKVMTEAGNGIGEIQISDQVCQGTVLIPHGFGLNYDGRVHGINVNSLTKNTHRDPLGTPLHRFVPCRVEAV